MKNTRKPLFTSILALTLCVCMLLGTTFAWFTDSVTSAGNKIESGNLRIDLELLDKDGTWHSLKQSKAPIFDYDNWEPGYIDVKILKVENEGSLALKWKALFVSEAELSKLAEVIDVYVLPGASAYPDNRDIESLGYQKVGTVAQFVNSIEQTTYGVLEAGQFAYLGIALKMQETAGNEYQELSLGGAFDIRIVATQLSSEFDSFDDQYDAEPADPVIAFRSETLQAGQDSVTINLFHKGEKLLTVIVPADAIADPTKPVTVAVDDIDPDVAVNDAENTKLVAYDISVSNLKDNLSGDQLVTVSISVPNGRAAVNSYHSGALIEDAVYDEVEGTVTFKTAHFSPFEFTTKEYEASNLAELREQMNKDGAYVRLTNDIVIDLSAGSNDRSEDHKAAGQYYNAVNIVAKDVAIDLNGHSITVTCGDDRNANNDIGALFYVGENGSLNIDDSVGTGFIKMTRSVYAVWAPHDTPSYVDIYGGAFIADSYAGDPIAPGGSNYNENSNRALIYAGTGGDINVYGGYFIFNNTPDDATNRNNGAFNAKDFHNEELITIHNGVMLINETYRQDPSKTSRPDGSYDNYSVKLYGEDEGLCKLAQVTLSTPVVIDGKEYATWYRVERTYYNLIFKDNNETTLDTVQIPFTEGDVTVGDKDDTAYGKLTGDYATDFGGWTNVAGDKITSISADNTKDVVLYPTLAAKYTVRWVDENGNVIGSTAVKKDTKYSSLTAPGNPESQYDHMTFDHWEIREKDSSGKVTYTKISPSDKITKDVTLYPYYTYNAGAGSIALKGHDDDGDGRYDRYTVEAAAGLSGSVTIPGVVNGVPVTVITDLSGDTVNGLLGGGIKSVIIKEGVQEIGSDAFAGTAGLNYVEVPLSVTKVGSNAFSSGWGAIISKTVTIKYAGTWAQWQAACGGADSDTNWDSGLGKGSKVECTDGTYVLDTKYGSTDHNWSKWKKQ